MSKESNIRSLREKLSYKSTTYAVLEKKLLKTFTDLSYQHLHAVMQGMFDNADDSLFKLVEKSDEVVDQSIYFDSMRLVRLQKENIQLSFFGHIKNAFLVFPDNSFCNSSDSDLIESESEFDNMQLMGEDQLEEVIAISSISSKLNAEFSSELSAIQMRFSELYSGDELVSIESLPFSPKNICSAFNEAFKILDVELEIRLILLKLFDQHIIKGLSYLYSEVNQHFIDEGILPKIKHRIKNEAKQTTYSHSSDLNSSNSYKESTGNNSSTELDNSVAPALFSELQQLLNMSASNTAPDFNLGAGQKNGLENGHNSGNMIMAHDELLNSIQKIQNHELDILQSTDSMQTGNSVKQFILSQNQANDTGSISTMSQVDNDLIDIVSMLFEYILDDELIVPVIRASLARLQIPMIKVALLDKQFINSKSHPARCLLNKLAKAGLGVEGSTSVDDNPIVIKINEVVARIINEFVEDVSLFDSLLDDFIGFQESSDHIASTSAHKKIKAKEDVALAQAWVREVLSERLIGKTLPKAVVDIIQGPWKEVLLNTYLQEGESSRVWKNQIRFIDVMAWSVESKKNGLDRTRLGNIISYLVNTLREGLTSLNYSSTEIELIFKAIEPYHYASLHGHATPESLHSYDEYSSNNTSGSFFLYSQSDDKKEEHDNPEDSTAHNSDAGISDIDSAIMKMEQDFKQLSDPFETEIIVEGENENQLSVEGLVLMDNIVLEGWDEHKHEDVVDDEYLQLARHLELGKWVEFSNEQGGKTRAKLSWKSELLGEFVFLDWKYSAVADKSMHGLATDLRQGRCRILDEGPLLDRAFSYVIQKLSSSKE